MSRNISGTLLVPIHLDALLVGSNGLSIFPEMADYSNLPYWDGHHYRNEDNAYLSEIILAQPFTNDGLTEGIHLHWALPDALTHGSHDTQGTHFPLVPNRWAILRRGGGYGDETWVVESDYIYPTDTYHSRRNKPDAVTVRYESDYDVPFRYIGQASTLSDWLDDNTDSNDYLDHLTAIGPWQTVPVMDTEKATFAAFYPNCRTVFGFQDYDISGDNIPNGVSYYVIGWYSDGSQDCVAQFINHHADLSNDQLLTALQTEFSWDIEGGASSQFPQNSLYYAKLTFQRSGQPDKPADTLPQPNLTVGSTGTEALSAQLANIISGHNGEGDQSIKLEEQLEAIQLLPQLEGEVLDHLAAFKEARHSKGFSSHSAGLMWTIQADNQQTDPTHPDSHQITLPDDLAETLNQLNLHQQAYEQGLTELESMRLALFNYWYKYMLCCHHGYTPPDQDPAYYPSIDQAKDYMQSVIGTIKTKVSQVGQLQLAARQADSSINQASANSGLAQTVAQTLTDLVSKINQHNRDPQMQAAKKQYRLKPLSAPRYWQATEPSLLLTGPAVQPTDRHSRDGRLTTEGWLTCHRESSFSPANWQSDSNLQSVLESLKRMIDGFGSQPNIGVTEWTQQPWNPILLEWEVNMSGFKPTPGNATTLDYGTSFINHNYNLATTAVDLSHNGSNDFASESDSYTGVSLLTPHANLHLQDKIVAYLNQYLLPDYYTTNDITLPTDTAAYLQAHISDIKNWYDQNRLDQHHKSNDSIYTALQAYEQLQSLPCLSQALSGFNDALIMLKRTMQLNVDDPLYEGNDKFPSAVKDAIGSALTRAPRPLSGFSAFRNGLLSFGNLCLVDNFGQIKTLVDPAHPDQANFTVAETFREGNSHTQINLRPRLAQPARLNFRWLSATADTEEMNAHPATSPICGWLLPNNLDSSLMTYTAQGESIGSINSQGNWVLAPQSGAARQPNAISNAHLRQMVQYLLHQGQSFQQAFLSATDNALETIDPASFAQHQGLALLMARPIALVRVALSFDLHGLPAEDNSWDMFQHKLNNHALTGNHNFAHVDVPIRLGEYQKLNDGLVGYWVENGAGGPYQDNTFYTPQSNSAAHSNIKTHASGSLTIPQRLNGSPQYVSMLIDPRGAVHATTGLLPTKAIVLPRDQYSQALSKIDITFLTTPLLTNNDELNLSLPPEPGYEWSWLTQTNGRWQETNKFEPLNPNAVFNKPQVLREGWLKLKQKS